MSSYQKGKARLDDCEDIQDLVSTTIKLRDYLTAEEEIEIHRQFRSRSWQPSRQVLWSGMLRSQAQKWADAHQMQTLTTAMGPLMNTDAPSCLRQKKSNPAWSKYIHGASAVFAWHIASSDRVIVLCPPPPQRFHPSGLSSYQTIEEPILKAAIAEGAVLRIELVHPRVKGAEDFRYQLWPLDEAEAWVAAYGNVPCSKCKWRKVKGDSPSMSSHKVKKPQPSIPTSETPCKLVEVNKQAALPATAIAPASKLKPSPTKSKKKKAKKKNKATCTATATADGPPSSFTRSKTKTVSKAVVASPRTDLTTASTPSRTVQPAEKERNPPRMSKAATTAATAPETIEAELSNPKPTATSPQASTTTTKRQAKQARKEERRAKKASRTLSSPETTTPPPPSSAPAQPKPKEKKAKKALATTPAPPRKEPTQSKPKEKRAKIALAAAAPPPPPPPPPPSDEPTLLNRSKKEAREEKEAREAEQRRVDGSLSYRQNLVIYLRECVRSLLGKLRRVFGSKTGWMTDGQVGRTGVSVV